MPVFHNKLHIDTGAMPEFHNVTERPDDLIFFLTISLMVISLISIGVVKELRVYSKLVAI